MHRLAIGFLSLITSAACGVPNSGVASNKNLDDLTREERTQICQYMHDVAPPDGEYNCVRGPRSIERNLPRCIDRRYWGEGQEQCTVALLEDCYSEIADSDTWCALDVLGPCESAAQCGFGFP